MKFHKKFVYIDRKISNISRTKFQNLNDSWLVLQLSVPMSIEAMC